MKLCQRHIMRMRQLVGLELTICHYLSPPDLVKEHSEIVIFLSERSPEWYGPHKELEVLPSPCQKLWRITYSPPRSLNKSRPWVLARLLPLTARRWQGISISGLVVWYNFVTTNHR